MEKDPLLTQNIVNAGLLPEHPTRGSVKVGGRIIFNGFWANCTLRGPEPYLPANARPKHLGDVRCAHASTLSTVFKSISEVTFCLGSLFSRTVVGGVEVGAGVKPKPSKHVDQSWWTSNLRMASRSEVSGTGAAVDSRRNPPVKQSCTINVLPPCFPPMMGGAKPMAKRVRCYRKGLHY